MKADDSKHDVDLTICTLTSKWSPSLFPQSGGVSDMEFRVSDRQPKFKVIDKYSNDNVMQLDGFRKADSLVCESLDTGAHRQMLAFNLLRVPFLHRVPRLVSLTSAWSPLLADSRETSAARDSYGPTAGHSPQKCPWSAGSRWGHPNCRPARPPHRAGRRGD